MLTLDSVVSVPAAVLSTSVDQDAVLLDAVTNKYYSLDEVGARIWTLLTAGQSLRSIYQTLLAEYEVEPQQLEQDIIQLLSRLADNGLIIIQGDL